MIGMAKRLYQEKGGKPFSFSKSKWPLLERLLNEDILDFVDYSLAHLLLREEKDASEEVAALICYLSKAARMGHLCVRFENEKFIPDPAEFWNDDFQNCLRKGLSQIPPHLISDVSILDSHPSTPLCRYKNFFYLQRHWVSESGFFHSYQRLICVPPTIAIDLERVEEILESRSLNTLQKEAVIQSCKHGFSVLCGGPGTGKTYTASEMIRVFQQLLPEGSEIALAAPTGKAAANLEKSLPFKAKTLHALLGIRSRNSFQKEPERLTADVIVVDESSMIDVNMMTRLLQSIKPGARLILLGDPYQLPPVEAGSLFSDIVHSLQTEDDSRVNELKQCLRTDLQTIVDFAEIVKLGQIEKADQFPLIPLDRKKLLEYALSSFPSKCEDPQETWNRFQKFRLLSPLRKGPFGVDAINDEIYRALKPTAAPIMLTSNDYRLELFNGEVGLLIRENPNDPELAEGDYALFPAGDGQPMKKFPAMLLPRFEYAYCLSVHKSQGSEFDHVVMLLPEGSEGFGRELLYTGITRARKHLELWGDPAILRETIRRHSRRLSGMMQ